MLHEGRGTFHLKKSLDNEAFFHTLSAIFCPVMLYQQNNFFIFTVVIEWYCLKSLRTIIDSRVVCIKRNWQERIFEQGANNMLKIRIIGDDVLRREARPVDEFDEQLRQLSNEMIDIMHRSDGIGLAAPQVGISKRLLVTDISPIEKDSTPKAFVNPVILESQGECTLEEGCLSIPEVREDVTRPERILLKYQTVEGETITESYDGWMARVLQHEIDHLDGVLFIDHLTPVKQKIVTSRFINV